MWTFSGAGSEVLAAQLAGAAPNLNLIPLDASVLDGGRFLAGRMFEQVVGSALVTFSSLLALLTLTLVVRRTWIAVVTGASLVAWIDLAGSPTPLFSAPFFAVNAVIDLTLLLRVGLLAHMTSGTLITTAGPVALTLHPPAWYASYGWAVIAVIMGGRRFGRSVNVCLYTENLLL